MLITHMYINIYINIQDDLLARVIFCEFTCGKLIGEIYSRNFVPRVIEHAQIETKWRIL